MKYRTLGQGLNVSAIGLGCMGMNWGYGAKPEDREDGIATIRHALDQGITFLDTADVYGPHTNEELVGEAIKGRRHDVVLATKFGLTRGLAGSMTDKTVNGQPSYVKEACETSLKRLGVDVIDLYYLHRLDPDTAIEDTVGAMKELIDEGKIRYIGLSEVSSATIRRAHAIHPLTAVQSEYSLWSRDVDDFGIKATLDELKIGLVPYAPLGRGFLTGQIRSLDDLAQDDYRRISPRFQGDNFQKNLDIVERIQQMASEKNITAAQLALAWVLAQGEHIVPIPGTRHVNRLDENIAALNVSLSQQECESIESILPKATGARYPETTIREIDV